MSKRHYGRYSVETANEEKCLFEDARITKGELLDYYERVWERIEPHLRNRALVMQRFPDGIHEEGFYQKEVPDYFPDWLDSVRVDKRSDGSQRLVVCQNKAGLVYLANQACITPHPWLSRVDRLEFPDQLVIDLDPSDDDFASVRRAALQCKTLLDELELFSVVKTTGSRGVHVTVPLHRTARFDTVREFAKRLAELLEQRHGTSLTTEQRKDKRRGRLYLDVARNAYAQTAVAPYAVRARPGAPVATPIDWSELEAGEVHAQSFRLRDIQKRLDRPDPWTGWRRHARDLRPASQRLDELDRDVRS